MKKHLLELARLHGIWTAYTDMSKQRREADPEALLQVLRAMGAGVESFEDVPSALQRRKEELRLRKAESVFVAWDGVLNGKKYEFGYHDEEIGGGPAFVISAPRRAYFPGEGKGDAAAAGPKKRWGLFAPIYALHSAHSPLAGDLSDFESLADWMHDLGGTVAATLPLLGAFLDEPFEPSPYSPATRLFWNEFYVDVTRIPEFGGRRVPPLPEGTEFVDYRAIMAHKRSILEDLAGEFFGGSAPGRMKDFRRFVRDNPGVEDYAKFRAVTDRHRKSWHSWPAALRDGRIRSGDYDEAAKNYHLYAQWVVQEQLEGLSRRAGERGQFLYLDLPLGLNGASYDIWRNRGLFVIGASGGAPPDPVFTKGQNWGFPPMNPEALRRDRYRYVISYLRNHFRFSKLLRIDHVMGLHRLYWIPEGLTGDKGVYVNYPAEELWAILSLESHRYGAGIVGENLGTVPPAVNAAMTRHAIRKMYVVQYEIMGKPEQPTLPAPPAKSVASLNTHDMPPFRAFLDGLDIEDRLDLGFTDEKMAKKERKERRAMRLALQHLDARAKRGKAFEAATRFLADSKAEIVLVNLEDLWEETLSQNVPATYKERPNWSRRVRPSIEQIRKMAAVAEALSNVFNQRSRSLSL